VSTSTALTGLCHSYCHTVVHRTQVYLERFRNLDYLEHELDEYDAAARAETEEHTRRRARAADKVRKEQLKQFIGREPASEAAIEEELQRGK
jgi:hypothetical protein